MTLSHHAALDDPPAVAVVLVHFGEDPAPTLRCLESLRCVETVPHTVIVVDNGPDPGCGKTLNQHCPWATVIPAHHNPGFGAACNIGAQSAWDLRAKAIWFLNNDAIIEVPLLARFLELTKIHPQIGLWGTQQIDRGRLIGADRHPAWWSRGLEPSQSCLDENAIQLGVQESLSGASIFLTRTAWQEIGPWPEWCFLYWEDAAWCRQAREAGLGLGLLKESIRHDRGTTTGHKSALTVYYGMRNALLLHRQLFPDNWTEAWRLAAYGLQKRVFRGQFRSILPMIRGILDARANPPRRGRHSRY